jgi:hypothetical protein
MNEWRKFPELPALISGRVTVFVLQKYDKGLMAHGAVYNASSKTFHKVKLCKECSLGPIISDVVRWRYA